MASNRGLRPVITLLGRCNTGKSSLLNFIVGQDVVMVSQQPGTTADPVLKAFELLPLGPVSLYDTAGLDESTELGRLRQQASRKIIKRSDLALLVTDEQGLGDLEKEALDQLKQRDTPLLVVFNKSDIKKAAYQDKAFCDERDIPFVEVSARHDEPAQFRQTLLAMLSCPKEAPPLLADLLPENPLVVCVAPIDSGAPAGRIILPQVQLLREVLDINGQALLLQPPELAAGLALLKREPDLVVTDSQVLARIESLVPQHIMLTTFSLLFARQKGDIAQLLQGTDTIKNLKNSDKVLIAEACSHHAQKEDIGRVKLPALLQKFSGVKLNFAVCAGNDFPEDLERYALVLHCGGCMLNRKAMLERLDACGQHHVEVSNFGMAIAACHQALERVTRIFRQK